MANNNWAVVIGINQYKHLPEAQLSYAESDAQNMRDFLCQKAGFAPNNVLLCTDHSKPVGNLFTDPDYTNLRKLLHQDIQQARGADLFWFFFSGHGMVGQDHEDYLLARDSNPNDEATAISINFVIQCLRRCQAKDIVLILDMCRHERADDSKGAEGEVGRKTEEIARQQGIITIFSCSRDQRSYEIADLKQGAFTYALLEGLNHHTILRRLEDYLIRRVRDLNEQYGKRIQEPLIIPEPGWKYDLPLLLECATKADIKDLRGTATKAELEEDYERAERLWWQVIEISSSRTIRISAHDALKRIQRKKSRFDTIHASLTDKKLEDTETVTLELQPTATIPEPPSSPLKAETKQEPQVELKREKGVDYTKLRDLLATGQWKEADQETWTVMCQVAGREKEGWLRDEDIQNLPSEDLRTIDQLWVKHSGSTFGSSVYKEEVKLKSEKGIDYTKLRDLLEAENWKEADTETARVMRQAVGSHDKGWLEFEEIKQFPREDLRIIDQLWVKYSKGKFGFSVQKQIWLDCGGIPGEYDYKAYEKFGDRVGWRKRGSWASYSDLTFNFHLSPELIFGYPPRGHLPASFSRLASNRDKGHLKMVDGRFEHSDLFSRLATIERVDYTKLRDFLAAGKWKEANQETSILILKAAGCEEQKYLDYDSIKNIPCEDLYIIDQLWVKYSKGKFGFSVQQQIWSDCGGLRGSFTYEVYEKYCDRVGWRKREGHNEDRISGVLDEDLTFELLDTTPKGHLPGDQPVFTWSGNSRRRLILLMEFLLMERPMSYKKGVDYTKLRDLLAAGKWKEADQETRTVMCQVAGREKEGWLRDEDIQNFPCKDLRTIDQLWIQHSNDKFGFSVQKQIWSDCGGVPGEYDYDVYKNYCDRVGWRKRVGILGMGGKDWVDYDDLTFELSDSTPRGHLPGNPYPSCGDNDPSDLPFLAQRLEDCNI